MTDETPDGDDKRKNVNDFAADLMKAMKSNADKPLGDIDADDDNDTQMPDDEPSEQRQALLKTLENDVDALGWDQPAKLWGVLVDDSTGEEYLKLITTLKGDPVEAIFKMAKKGRAKENVKGVVVMTEGWGLPKSITEPLAGNNSAIQAWFRASPPREHPNRIESRSVTLFSRDRTYATIERVRGEDAMLQKRLHAPLVPAVAALLGMDKVEKQEITPPSEQDMLDMIDELCNFLKFMVKTKAGMERVIADGGTPEQFIRSMLEDLPKEKRDEMVKTMPAKLKKILGL